MKCTQISDSGFRGKINVVSPRDSAKRANPGSRADFSQAYSRGEIPPSYWASPQVAWWPVGHGPTSDGFKGAPKTRKREYREIRFTVKYLVKNFKSALQACLNTFCPT